MTKHLRFLIVLLMTLVWSAGWAQTTIDFTNGLPADWSNKGTVAKVDYQNKSCIQLYTATITSSAFKDAFSSMKISLTRSKNGTNFTISYQIGNAAAVLIKTYTSSQVTKGSWKDYIIDIPTAAQVANCKFIFKSDQASYYISSIEFTKAGPSKTPTKVAFTAEYSNKTFTFTEGKLEGFTAPTATETNNVAGTIKYSSNNESAVKVNASTGELSFPGYGEATITATFTPTDADTYAVSTDSYKVVNKADLGDFVFYESFDKCNGKGGNDDTFGSLTNGVDLTATNADNEGWKFTQGYVASKCVRFGTGEKAGSATTPSITVTGKGDLSFMAAAWNGDKTTITVSVSDGATLTYNGKTSSYISVNINRGSWTNIDNIEISGAKTFTITFAANGKNNRFFLDEVMVKDIPTVTLDETATNNTIEAKKGVNVTLKRTMKADMWNTICLPFAVTMDKAKAAFGDNVKIVELDTKAAVDANVLSFKASTGIEAATPYLIKPSAVSETGTYTFDGVDITETNDENAYSFNNVKNPIAFKGIYNMVDITTDVTTIGGNYYAAFLGANNTIFKANVGGKMKGFRAYFAIPYGTSASALRVVIDGTATSIKNIESEVVESNAPVYNLQGQRVDGSNLTPGIYVKAGKKFVVK